MKRKISLAVLLIVVLAGAAWLFLRPAPAPPPVLLHPTTRQVAETENRLTGLGDAAASPGTKPRTLRLSESDLNVVLSGSQTVHKLLAKHGVKAVQAILQEPDDVVIHAAVTVQGKTQNIQIAGTLAPDPKLGIRFAATSAQVGSLPLPTPLVTSEANGLAARFSRQFLGKLSISVQSVSIQKKTLVVVGIPTAAPIAPTVPASPRSASPVRH